MCDSHSVDDGNDGCLIECAINEAVSPNWHTDWSWSCIPLQEVSDTGCPGDFQNDCQASPEEFDPQCACPEEMWMNADCSEAFLCQNEEAVVCGEGQIVNPLIIGNKDKSIGCPGAYHLGCNGTL